MDLAEAHAASGSEHRAVMERQAGAFEHPLGEPAQQPVRAGQAQPLRTRPLHKRPDQLLVDSRRLHADAFPVISSAIWCLLRLRSYHGCFYSPDVSAMATGCPTGAFDA